MYGDAGTPGQDDNRVGVIPSNLGTMHHTLVAAILGSEAGDRRAERLLLRSIVRGEAAAHEFGRAGGEAAGAPRGRSIAEAGNGSGAEEQVAAAYAALLLSTLPERQFGSSAQ